MTTICRRLTPFLMSLCFACQPASDEKASGSGEAGSSGEGGSGSAGRSGAAGDPDGNSGGGSSGGGAAGSGSGTGGATGSAGASGSAGSGGASSGEGGSGNQADAGVDDPAPATDGGPAVDPSEPGGIKDGLTQLLVSRGVGLGYYHACHILEDQKVRCFGSNDPRNRPPADVLAAKVEQINCAHNGCCALLPPGSNKKMSCWSHKQTFYPPNNGNDLDPLMFGIGYDHACALNKDNTVKCWGNGPGRGPQTSAPAGLRAKSIAVATFFNCAIQMDDTVMCWGAIDRNPPEPTKAKLVAAINHHNTRADEDDITMSTGHVCAILMDDTLKCWGDNIDGTTDVPPDLGRVRDVAAATYNTCAVKLDGEVRCWGTRKYNSSPQRYNPQPEGIRLKGIRARLATYCGLTMDNTMACWGDESSTHITIPAGTKFYSP